MRSVIFSTAIVALLMSSPMSAHDFTQGDVEVIHPHIPAPAPGAKTAAVYMALSNNGDEPLHLIGVETAAARTASVHRSEINGDVARMVEVPDLEIPAHDTVLFEPGGLHVMLMGLIGPLKADTMVPATLIFETAGRVEIEFMVTEQAPSMPHDHDKTHTGHKHHEN